MTRIFVTAQPSAYANAYLSDSMEYYEMLLSQMKSQGILIHDTEKHLQSISLLNE